MRRGIPAHPIHLAAATCEPARKPKPHVSAKRLVNSRTSRCRGSPQCSNALTEVGNRAKVAFAHVTAEKAKVVHECDFGDAWQHDIGRREPNRSECGS